MTEEYKKLMLEIESSTGRFTGSYRKLKLALIVNDPRCYYCRKEVKDYGRLPDGMSNPKDMATIDHTVSRFFRKKGERVVKVLCCFSCNHKNHAKEQILFPAGLK